MKHSILLSRELENPKLTEEEQQELENGVTREDC